MNRQQQLFKKFLILIFSITLIGNSGFTQDPANRNNVWYFGNGSGLDLNGGARNVLNNSIGLANEGAASISDQNGNILFYVDGRKLVDASTNPHTVVANFTTTGAGGTVMMSTSVTQGFLILPKPNSLDEYYIVANGKSVNDLNIGDQITINDFNYTTRTLNSINDIIFAEPGMSEAMSSTVHANGTDYWICTYVTGKLIAIQITDDMTNGPYNVVETNVPGGTFRGLGEMKFGECKDGIVKMAYVAHQGQVIVETYDFNTATGIFSNRVDRIASTSLLANEAYYGVDFSPSENFLYINNYYLGVV